MRHIYTFEMVYTAKSSNCVTRNFNEHTPQICVRSRVMSMCGSSIQINTTHINYYIRTHTHTGWWYTELVEFSYSYHHPPNTLMRSTAIAANRKKINYTNIQLFVYAGRELSKTTVQQYRFILEAPRHSHKHTRARIWRNCKLQKIVLRFFAANGVATPSATAKHQRQRQLLFCWAPGKTTPRRWCCLPVMSLCVLDES